MNINKNISVWRGNNTPPTDYHLWIKSDGTSFIKVDDQYKLYYNPNVGDVINVTALTNNKYILESDIFRWVSEEGRSEYHLNLHFGVRILFREWFTGKWNEYIYIGLDENYSNPSNWKLYNQEDKFSTLENDISKLNNLKISKVSPNNNQTLASYILVNGLSQQKGVRIDIPKDKTIKSIRISDSNATINSDGEIIDGNPTGTTSLCIVYVSENRTYDLVKVDFQNFIEEKEISDGLSVNNHLVKVKIDPSTENFISVNSNGVKLQGLQDTVDKVKTIWDGNPELVSPVISGTWSLYNNNEELIGQNTSFPLVFGYKVKYSGTWKWESSSNKKDPKRTEGNWGTTLPSSGQSSSVYNSNFITTNTTISQKIYANKKGLMVSGQNILPASGEDSKTSSVSASFSNRIYYGNCTTNNPNESDIKSLSTKLGSKEQTITNVTAQQYYIYAYPQTLGKLTTIIQDGATPVLGAFSLIESINITNAAGLNVPLYVYVSNNPGAFTNNKLNFN